MKNLVVLAVVLFLAYIGIVTFPLFASMLLISLFL
jgi:hypothetical protein